jgi:hypothetical protein
MEDAPHNGAYFLFSPTLEVKSQLLAPEKNEMFVSYV